jgi:hypothetical protein
VNNRKGKNNFANRFAVILFISTIINIAFFWLPDSIFGIRLKKIDLLSDLRIPKDETNEIDDLLLAFEDDEELEVNLTNNDSINNKTDSLHFRSYYGKLPEDSAETDSPDKSNSTNISSDFLTNKNIEDFTYNHSGLRHFFAALNNANRLGRPVRIAFVGDSFIEGDILVADFRAMMQGRFGGYGIGFIPISSNVAQYRPTINQSANGWKTYSIVNNRNKSYSIAGQLFEPTKENASFNYTSVNMYPGLDTPCKLKFLYSKNIKTELVLEGKEESEIYKLSATDEINILDLNGTHTKASIKFRNIEGFEALGISLESNEGIIVDNLSLRGNSGLAMSGINSIKCQELQEIRPYDLIILQYGLNVVSDSVKNYNWYRDKMVNVIRHIKESFPGADIMLLGVSDRSHRRDGSYNTMPGVISLLKSQRQIAINAEITFWNTFAAMGGQNSMVTYVKNNWASKDYTHLSFRGGKELAKALYDAILTEKEMYDGDEKLIE